MALHDPYALAMPAHDAGSGSRAPSPTIQQQQDLATRPDAEVSPESIAQTVAAANSAIQSLLVPSHQDKPETAWRQPQALAESSSASLELHTSSAKRKHDDEEDPTEPHNKVARVIQPQDAAAHVMPMTTVICLHAAVAQKSYGTEKRFLCPPPVVHVEGPVWHMRSQQLTMAVVTELGERSFEQKAPLDNSMTSSFKALHVTGSAKSKSFSLSLEIAQPPPGALPSENSDAPTGRVWASFDSAPVSIISKPSKKTAKTRNITSTILAGGPVSLFNRINSQTVRTKYMTIENAQLCASNITWSAFNVNVVRRESEPPSIMDQFAGPQAVTYGSEIILSDTHSGISTSPLIIRKVDKGRIATDDGGPVSQMQKVALQRMNADGTRHYLSAAGPIPGTGGMVAAPAAGNAGQSGTHPLLFQSPRVKEEIGKHGMPLQIDEVDDYLCWTIVGISKFQYTFFDTSGRTNNIPEVPITPFPTLFSAPIYRQGNNTVELTVSNFFYENPATSQQVPMDVFLGNLGPLRHRVYQPTSVGGMINGDGGRFPTHIYTIVIVEMPAVKDVMKALEEDALPPPTEPPPEGQAPGPPSLAGRSLPLLFIRASDGVGYHSGRTITCESIFPAMAMHPPNIDTSWLAQAAADTANNMNFTLRVL